MTPNTPRQRLSTDESLGVLLRRGRTGQPCEGGEAYRRRSLTPGCAGPQRVAAGAGEVQPATGSPRQLQAFTTTMGPL